MTDTATRAPRDFRIVSDNRHDDATLSRLAPGYVPRRAAAGLLTGLAPHVLGRLSAVDRDGHEVPMAGELLEVAKARRHA